MGWVQVGNSEHVCSFETGDARISTSVLGQPKDIVLGDVTFSPDRMCNLISKRLVRRAGFRFVTEK